MGFMDFFGNLFESNVERERRIARNKRRAEYAVESVIDKLNDKTKQLEKERDALWEKAKIKLQSGQKTEAASTLRTYKSKMIMLNRLDRQKIFAQHKLDMLTSATDMIEVTKALGTLANISDVSPEQLQDGLMDIDMASGEISEINKQVDKAFAKEMDRINQEVERDSSDDLDDELMAALENEAAGMISGGQVSSAAPASTNNNQQAIDAGLSRLKKIMNDK